MARAQHNIQFAQSFDLTTTPYVDWVVTAYFYAALHLVDAVLDKQNIHPPGHKIRNELVRERWELRPIRDAYRELKTHSENARYQLYPFTSIRIQNDVIPCYEEIATHLQQHLESFLP